MSLHQLLPTAFPKKNQVQSNFQNHVSDRFQFLLGNFDSNRSAGFFFFKKKKGPRVEEQIILEASQDLNLQSLSDYRFFSYVHAANPIRKAKNNFDQKRPLFYLKQLSHNIRVASNVLLESSRVHSRPIWVEAQIIGRCTEINSNCES